MRGKGSGGRDQPAVLRTKECRSIHLYYSAITVVAVSRVVEHPETHFYIRQMELAYIYHPLYCNPNLLYPRHIFIIRQSRNKILKNNLYDLTYLFQLREYYLLKFFLILFIAKHKSQRASQSNFL